MGRSSIALCAVIAGITALALGCAGEITEPESVGSGHSPLTGDPDLEDCGWTISEGPEGVPIDACLDGPNVQLLYGPHQFARAGGAPEEFSDSFEVAEEGAFCLKVSNDGIAAARVATVRSFWRRMTSTRMSPC